MLEIYPQMNVNCRKIVLFSGIGLVTLLFLFTITLRFFYADVIGPILKKELQKSIKSKISFQKDFELSFWSSFPAVSCNFFDVNVMELGNKEPLLSAKKLGFNFDFWDFIHKNYVVKSITVEDGWLLLQTNEAGIRNYDILVPSKETTMFSISAIDLTNITITYSDLFYDQHFSTLINSASWIGSLKSDRIDGAYKMNAHCKSWRSGTAQFLTNKDLNIAINIKGDLKANKYNLNESKINIANNEFELNGDFQLKDKNTFLDLELDGSDLDIEKLAALAPSFMGKLKSISHNQGKFHLNTRIAGEYDDRQFPVIQGEFGMDNGKITPNALGYPISKVSIKGSFDNGSSRSMQSAQLRVDHLSFYMPSKKSDLKLVIDDLSNPIITLSGNLALDTYVCKDLLKDYCSDLDGMIFLNELAIKGPLALLQKGIINDQVTMSGNIVLENIGFSAGNSAVNKINGAVSITPESWQTDILNVVMPESNFSIKGKILNLNNYVSQFIFNDTAKLSKPLDLELTIASSKLDIGELIALTYQNSNSDTSALAIKELDLKENAKTHWVNGNISLAIEKLNYENVKLANLTGNIEINDDFFIINPLKLEGFGGSGWIKGKYKRDGEKNIHTWTYTHLENIRIDELMRQFDNFDQDYFTDDNIQGKLSTDAIIKAVWDPSKNLRKNNSIIYADMSIREGQLYKFKPLEEALDGYASASDRRKVQFSHLQNQLIFKKDHLLIPTMSISTNVGDFILYGKQYYNLKFDYYTKVNVTDLLLKKWDIRAFEKDKSANKSSELFSKYMYITGDVNAPIFGQLGRPEIKNIMDRGEKKDKINISEMYIKEFPY